MGDKLSVIFCTDGIFPEAVGGMQRHSRLLIEELANGNAIDIKVIHPHNKQLFDPSLKITEFPLNFSFKGNYIKACYQYSKLIYKILSENDADIIYSQGFSVWYGMKKFRQKLIVNPHGLEPFQTLKLDERIKTIPMRMVERKQFRYAAKVISLGGRLTDILRRECADPYHQIVVIPNAVKPLPSYERNFDKPVLQLLFVGRFASNKGINILLEAVKQLNKDGYRDRLFFNLVGKGPLYDVLKSKYDLPNINFIGFADDASLAKLYQENDLFVLPTLFEGMPTVVLEAMMSGLPVVVSDTGATRELVDSTNGYLIEAGNIRSLKWGLQSFYQLNAEERLALSRASYEKANAHFTWSKVAEAHLKLFESFRDKK